ncbi:MAG: TRAP transporter small permease [Paracoccaceae bacterium]|nr:TRAP transporter small permease [Paracoccaceae bacterium]
MMRRFLDRLYLVAGGISALCIILICLVVSAQILLNILARLGGPSLSFTIPSYADFAGFFLATASFMGLAYTLRRGAHIRVNLVVQLLPMRARMWLEVLTLAGGGVISGYATYYMADLLSQSWQYGDKSPGIIAIPLWIPQVMVVTGLALLTVAFVDTALEALRKGAPVLVDEGGVE